jgi:long-chain acyl-CoA synthetase
VKNKVQKIGWALSSLRLTEKDDDGNAFLGLWSKNRYEWLVMDLVCIFQDIISVPIYDTLQRDALEYIVAQTNMKVLACDAKGLEAVLKLKASNELKSLETIITFDEIPPEILKQLQENNLKIFSLQELESLVTTGIDTPPSPNSIFTICYTSGTTGKSKGAMITHQNLISTMIGMAEHSYILLQSDVQLCYLPLAHIMERLGVHNMSSFGGSIGFYQGDILKLREDLAELKPTIFVSTPRLYTRFYDLISQQLVGLTGPKRLLATRALEAKRFYYRTQGSLTHKLWDSLVFNKIKNLLGGRVRLMVTGSAPISGDVMEFLKIVFCCTFAEGYGMTESSGGACLTASQERSTGIVGGPITTAELRIEDVPEMNYFSADVDEKGNPCPRGELCIRGPLVFAGYYKQPQITAETIDSEGWLHTGDIALRYNHNGSFKIIDRKKNLFKLQQGEYISPENIEMVYSRSMFIMQIFVHGDTLQAYLVAVVVPDEVFVRRNWAINNGFTEQSSFEEICRSDKLKNVIMEDMKEKAREAKLLGFELVKNIYLEWKPWTTNDLLTPTQKLMRFNAKKHYESVFSDMYSGVL